MHVCEYSHAYTFNKEVVQCHVDFFPSNSHHTPGQIPHNVSKLEQFSPCYLVCGHIFPGNRQILEQTFSLNSTIRIHSWKINTPFTERELALSVVCVVLQMTLQKKKKIEPDFSICEYCSIKLFLIHTKEYNLTNSMILRFSSRKTF